MVDDLSLLDERVSQILSSAWSTSTLSCRNSQWKRYLKFCADRGLPALPALLTTIVRFLAHLETLQFKYVTINNYLSSVVVLHKFYGLDTQIRESFLIKTVLAGLRNRLGNASTPKLPLTVQQLQTIFAIYPRTELNDCCWLAIAICFRTLLRKSNVLPDDNSTHALLRRDVVFYQDHIVFHVHTTKTRRVGEDTLVIPVVRVDNPAFCVYSLLYKHFTRYPLPPNSPLLAKSVSGVIKPLLYKDVSAFLKNCVQLLGVPSSRYGLHSLRRSGAVFLQSLGVPLHEIQLLGGWRSMAVMLYLASTFDRKLEIQTLVLQGLEQR